MKEKRNCKIVQDLLPNYIENLISEETNIYIEEHLKECDECREVLKNMKKDINLEENKNNNKKVKYIKKYKNRMRILRIIIIFIVFVVIGLLARKVIILDNLSNRAENNIVATNFHRISYSFEAGTFSKTDIYSLENRKKIMYTKVTEEGITKTTIITSNIENEKYFVNIYTETPTEKTVVLNKEMKIVTDSELFNPVPKTMVYYTSDDEKHVEKMSPISLIIYAIGASITETTYNGNKCYYVSNYKNPQAASDTGMYINKDTGLLVATIAYEIENCDSDNMERWPASEINYTFGTVTQDDFEEPDISQYTLKENI